LNFKVLILATGFKVQDFFAPVQITGLDGVDIMDLWKKEGPSAFQGIISHPLPNCFFALGPNSVTLNEILSNNFYPYLFKQFYNTKYFFIIRLLVILQPCSPSNVKLTGALRS
jgi:hypothetical protein